jgi:hypothetical protein
VRLSPPLRAIVALWGAWFTLTVADSGGEHACPTHAPATADGSPATRHASHAAVSAESEGVDPAEAGDAEHECTCLGTCCATAAEGILDPTSRPAALDGIAQSSAPVSDREPDGRRAYAHPFANGPPAAMRG